MILKTSNSKLAESWKARIRVGGESRARRDGRYKLDENEINNNEIDDELGKKSQKTLKSKKLFKSKKTVRSDFSISGARLAFSKLRQAFLKAPILHHFDPKYYIRNVTNVLSYTIGGIFS